MLRETVEEKLVGKVLTGFTISDDRTEITFSTKGEPVILTVYGDCCSFSWIESVDNPKALKGKVLSVEQIKMPNLGDIPGKYRERVERVAYYGLKIITEKGHCVIGYRNDSNGYYGGWIE